ncbi:MbtH family protein [Rubrivivax gelatinosus]|uniref:MbtH family protein n=1 Tax=Rubrivivax gelatinosus TaxID=28068 RepID=UPI0005C14018|nr:MbtH family NRPS accessory protein [Rubrivivax gelatinosus]MBG6082455.1 MbtH protein [Rubrivivax gelatinosus]
MTTTEPTQDTAKYHVVSNDEGQYSLLAEGSEPPAGWHFEGVYADREECLAYIERTWTDMRPRSLRPA